MHAPMRSGAASRRVTWSIALLVFAVAGPLPVADPLPAAEGTLIGMPDPSIIELSPGDSSGGYYIVATGAGLPLYHSTDLLRWRRVARVFDRPVPDWAARAVPGTRGIWAPDIARVGDRYYLYYCASTFGSQRSVIGLAVNRTLDPASPEYRWEDRGLVLDSAPGRTPFNAIDPALFVEPEGEEAWLFWGSYWEGIFAVEIDPGSGKPRPDAKPLRVARQRPPGTDIEAAYVIHRDGFYWLFVSFGSCCEGAKSTYRVMVGRSRKVNGPYVDFQGRTMEEGGATLVLAGHGRWRGTGHNSILRTKGRDYLVHHTYDTENLDRHRILQIRPLLWGPDGWPLSGEPLRVPPTSEESGDGPTLAASTIRGAWRLRVDYRGEGRPLKLLPGGRIDEPGGSATWRLEGRALELRWPDEGAPGGAWIDRVLVAPGGRTFVGRNQRGHVIHGERDGSVPSESSPRGTGPVRAEQD